MQPEADAFFDFPTALQWHESDLLVPSVNLEIAADTLYKNQQPKAHCLGHAEQHCGRCRHRTRLRQRHERTRIVNRGGARTIRLDRIPDIEGRRDDVSRIQAGIIVAGNL